MDPLSISASVIALLQLSSTVLGYLSDVKEGPKELKRIRSEVSSVLSLLITLQDQADRAIQGDKLSSSLNSLNVPNGPFQQFHSALERLASKLAPVEGWRKIGKAFKWPFEKKEMLEILNIIERLKALLSLARQNDHIALSKAIKGDIETLHEEVHETNLEVTNLRLDNKHREIRRWLSAPDPSSNYNRALKHRHARSGDWFLKSHAYMDWLSKPSSLLWLYGIPGCGKTILSSAIIQETIAYCGSRSKSVVLYFYFDFNDAGKQLHEQMIRSLISQLFMHWATVPSVLDVLYSSCMDGERQPSVESLLTTLHQIMTSIEETYIVLDALDECGDRPELLKGLQDSFDWKDVNCRMLVISRREKDIEDGLMSSIKQAEALCIHSALIDADIRQYIRDRLQSDGKLKKWQKEQLEIEHTLMQKANGMFRWAACQLDALCTCRSVFQLRKALGSLPGTLDMTYDRILGKISEEDYQSAFHILRWLAFSARPLHLEEVAEVLAIDAKELRRFDPNKRFKDPRDILEICSSLVAVDDVGIRSHTDAEIQAYTETDSYANTDSPTNLKTDAGTSNTHNSDRRLRTEVKLAHFSVKEYLASDRIRHGPSANYSLQETDCNESIAEDCLVYILHITQSDVMPSVHRGKYPLATYAAKYWTKHVQFVKNAASTALALANELFLSKGKRFFNWLGMYNPDQYPANTPLPHLFFTEGDSANTPRRRLLSWKRASPLYYASLLGLLESVVALLENGADCNVEGGYYENPLTAASCSGHIEIVQLLLHKGARINPDSGGYISTALEAASEKGHIEIVQLLLDKGARAVV